MDDAQQVQIVDNDPGPQAVANGTRAQFTASISPAAQSANLIETISRIAAMPGVDIDKLERLLAIQKDFIAQQALVTFNRDLRRAIMEMPNIEKRGKIIITEKNKPDKVIQTTPYALWDDANEIIKPILDRNNLQMRFEISKTPEQLVRVTCVLFHDEGHVDRNNFMDLPLDTTGSKNNVQGAGSSVTYGKRYTAFSALNITVKGEDNDGNGEDDSGPGTISEAQIERLKTLIEETGSDIIKFCKWAGVPAIKDLPQGRFDEAVKLMQAKQRRSESNA